MLDIEKIDLLSNEMGDRESWVYGWAGDRDRQILKDDATYTANQANCRPALLAVQKGEGVFVEDYSGRRYIDLHGNNCHHIGYQHPRLKAVLIEQLSLHSCNNRGFTNGVFTQLAKKISAIWPGANGHFYMVPGGAAAVEVALAISRVFTGRYKSISFTDSYHGRSFGAVSLTGQDLHRSSRLGPLLEGPVYVPSFRPNLTKGEDFETTAKRSLEAIKSYLQEGDIACLIAEPMSNDCHRPPEWFWLAVRDLCDRFDTLLVFDEVPTGLGKMGAFFNSDNFSTRPDLTILGKALGGAALPVAGVIADGRLDCAAEMNIGYFTHEKNPLMARAALETLNIILEEQLMEKAHVIGLYAYDLLQEVQQKYDYLIPSPIRHQGAMLSLDIVVDRYATKLNEKIASTVFYRCMEKGVILNYPARGNNLTFSFPLVIEKEHVDQVVCTFDEVLAALKV